MYTFTCDVTGPAADSSAPEEEAPAADPLPFEVEIAGKMEKFESKEACKCGLGGFL